VPSREGGKKNFRPIVHASLASIPGLFYSDHYIPTIILMPQACRLPAFPICDKELHIPGFPHSPELAIPFRHQPGPTAFTTLRGRPFRSAAAQPEL